MYVHHLLAVAPQAAMGLWHESATIRNSVGLSPQRPDWGDRYSLAADAVMSNGPLASPPQSHPWSPLPATSCIPITSSQWSRNAECPQRRPLAATAPAAPHHPQRQRERTSSTYR
eukprot:CAMPEP_0181199432 /NCGR_PEP_ID=MMETSP1096-20121128/17169_1 /TAXON_ID=156174 ORGANISM="Chrysochromulina ericina, Strain CCMP281" /NCGR_SAMPLE_ID=MMETSP1096 /ASSEMBLY_ACC=CAM_ASM_000453 /LENGTH=114 /DNA_ID=CAMNT_0023289605 /DNA_START=1032 /DNA_END=1374 /DNA_ORIENTATION=+